MAAMEELESLLLSLQALKPPGVTKTKIDAITAKCVENVQSDAAIVQKIVQQFQNSPITHKLGVLYVVDSVTRQWVERARLAGQAVSKNAAPGTFASGVQNVTNVLPSLMTDLVQSAPDNQKEKISKLLDIWERGQTFPLDMLASFKQKINNPQNSTYTPPGSPPNPVRPPLGQTNQQAIAPLAPATIPQDASVLLAALAGLAPQNAPSNAPPAAPPTLPFPQTMVPPPPPGFVLPPPPPPVASNGQAPAPVSAPAAGVNEAVNQVLQAMYSGNITPDQGVQILNYLRTAQNGGAALPPQPAVASDPQPATQTAPPPDRYEQNGSRFRDRSRSPDYNRRRRSPIRRSPPNRRDSPTYGAYDPNAGAESNPGNRSERGRGRGRNKGNRNGNEYRQRTPPPQRPPPSPVGNTFRNGPVKYIEWDHSLPRDHIKVLSRTLFIGGASGTEGEIRSIFSRFGKVQTCIVNGDKRHAFVKMLTRPDAVSAKEGMDRTEDPMALAKARQTRWGVGFGPRDCSDYSTGVSVIPISRLTDADRKWALTAENGGTGGQNLEGGMVIEEPDIEIGAGVSSKAISRRVPTDSGRGGRGGSSGRGGRGGFDNTPRSGRQERPHPQIHEPRHISPRPEPAVAVPPAVPGFGFQLPGF